MRIGGQPHGLSVRSLRASDFFLPGLKDGGWASLALAEAGGVALQIA